MVTIEKQHEGHDLCDVSTSWGGYLVCDTCKQTLRVDATDPDDGTHHVTWERGRPGDTIEDLLYILRGSDIYERSS